MILNKKTQLILYKEEWEQVEFLDKKKIGKQYRYDKAGFKIIKFSKKSFVKNLLMNAKVWRWSYIKKILLIWGL
jgi:hypothetical protein